MHGTYLVNEILLINPSDNVFDFGDFNIHYKDWLTFSGGTFLLKSKQPAHDKGTLVAQSPYPSSHVNSYIYRLVMSRTNILELHINNLPLLSFY